MTTARRLCLSLLAGALLVAGCQSSATPTATNIARPTEMATAQPASTATVGFVATVTVLPPTATTAPEQAATYTLTDPSVGLAALTSYRATLVQGFVGTANGQPENWSRTYTLTLNRAAGTRELATELTGAEPHRQLWLEAGGVLYQRIGSQPCTAGPIPTSTSLAEWHAPPGFLPGVAGAARVGAEVMDNVPATHYAFGNDSVGALDPVTSGGEFWVADAGGYVVRYSLFKQGGAEYFGDGLEGVLTWNYTLVQANDPDLLSAVPSDCPADLTSLPRPEAAIEVVSLPGLLSYTTADAPADVVAFYDAQLPVQDWQPGAEQVLGEHLALLTYTRAGQTLAITLTAAAGLTTVEVLLTPSPLEP